MAETHIPYPPPSRPQQSAATMSDDKKPDVDDEVQEETVAKSAEDRKAAAAMASLDATGGDDDASASAVDRDAVNKAMGRLAGGATEEKKEVKKVKVDAADVALLVEELELSKAKATELLKQHDGDAVTAMRAHIAVSVA
ncbi:hypothetical protein GGTG_07771 [Gaeumannomyces tritici R3-111a-1]|uniref:Nascent polypeptide-associated complex subunit alpha-like UBA domain-containing protein n=1 Tax=Gaeumannomyces tritici (strain R3-111a-1) TaxID=644352 RepID=J3P2M5_GAET3|nr:hypothetical protein GGTG_07771 [Gaeumannomyces tritici R3-111a-1]EJT73917.1 hypothetical protein GGTG_07771 [Gaeumannomyces tritici R3-111a-1]